MKARRANSTLSRLVWLIVLESILVGPLSPLLADATTSPILTLTCLHMPIHMRGCGNEVFIVVYIGTRSLLERIAGINEDACRIQSEVCWLLREKKLWISHHYF